MRLKDIKVGESYAFGNPKGHDYEHGYATIGTVITVGEMERKQWGGWRTVSTLGKFVKIKTKGGKIQVMLPRQCVELAAGYEERTAVRQDLENSLRADRDALAARLVNQLGLEDEYDLRESSIGIRIHGDRPMVTVTISLTTEDVFRLFQKGPEGEGKRVSVTLGGDGAKDFVKMLEEGTTR